MGFNDSPLLKFKKTSNTTWAKTIRGYTATVTFNALATPDRYNCTVDGVGSLGDFTSLRKAKNAFRKFLLNKPVDSVI